jgi:hypothetical protein
MLKREGIPVLDAKVERVWKEGGPINSSATVPSGKKKTHIWTKFSNLNNQCEPRGKYIGGSNFDLAVPVMQVQLKRSQRQQNSRQQPTINWSNRML